MAEALIRGLLRGKVFAADDIIVSGPREERMRELREKFGVRTTLDNREAAGASIVVLSVKPQILSRVLEQIAVAIRPDALVISIAAGVPVAAIQSRLAPGARVVRGMPNTPALVDAGATAIAGGEHARESDLEDAKRIFDAVGITVILDESQLDAVTGLSGSGPAYVFLLLEALLDAARQIGLPAPAARRFVEQTVAGSAALAAASPDPPAELRRIVTSPGGTTEAAMAVLEAKGVREAFIAAVLAAHAKAEALGKPTAAPRSTLRPPP